MDDLVELLHQDNHTLVVANGEVCTFHGRGISDLYRLLCEDPGFLKGASVADKVVGNRRSPDGTRQGGRTSCRPYQ